MIFGDYLLLMEASCCLLMFVSEGKAEKIQIHQKIKGKSANIKSIQNLLATSSMTSFDISVLKVTSGIQKCHIKRMMSDQVGESSKRGRNTISISPANLPLAILFFLVSWMVIVLIALMAVPNTTSHCRIAKTVGIRC